MNDFESLLAKSFIKWRVTSITVNNELIICCYSVDTKHSTEVFRILEEIHGKIKEKRQIEVEFVDEIKVQGCAK